QFVNSEYIIALLLRYFSLGSFQSNHADAGKGMYVFTKIELNAILRSWAHEYDTYTMAVSDLDRLKIRNRFQKFKKKTWNLDSLSQGGNETNNLVSHIDSFLTFICIIIIIFLNLENIILGSKL
ncbi:hypothetical protein ACJX0J_022348, partial [Zea mays]